MMSTYFPRIIGLSLLTATWSAACHADLHLVGENMPPYNYVDPHSGQVIGLSIDLLSAAAAHAQVKIDKIQQMPMIRAIEQALSEPDTCVMSLIRTPEREPHFRWVGPYVADHWVFYARDDFTGHLKTLDDAKRYRIGSDIHGHKTAYLSGLGFTELDLAQEDAMNARKLAVGRFDLWLVGLYQGMAFADMAGVTHIHPVFEVARVDYYLACNPNFSESKVDALQSALKTMVKNKETARLEAPYAAAITQRFRCNGREPIEGKVIQCIDTPSNMDLHARRR